MAEGEAEVRVVESRRASAEEDQRSSDCSG